MHSADMSTGAAARRDPSMTRMAVGASLASVFLLVCVFVVQPSRKTELFGEDIRMQQLSREAMRAYAEGFKDGELDADRRQELSLVRLAMIHKAAQSKILDSLGGDSQGALMENNPHETLQDYYAEQEARDHATPAWKRDEEQRQKNLEKYYHSVNHDNTIPKSHLAVTQDPKQTEAWEAASAMAYGRDPEAMYKMFYMAEKGNMTAALEYYKKLYFTRTRKQGALYPSKGEQQGAAEERVDASKDGDAAPK